MTNEIAITGTFRSGFSTNSKEPIALTDEIYDNLLQEYQEDINKRIPLTIEYDSIDNAVTPGIYYVHYDEDNVIGILFITSSDGIIQQKFSTTYSISNGEILPEYTKTQDYFRHNGDGLWTEWQKVNSEKDSFVIYANVADADGEEGVDNDVPIVAGLQETIRELYYALIEKGIQNISVYLKDTEIEAYMVCVGQNGDAYTKNGKQCIELQFKEITTDVTYWTYRVYVFLDGSLIITARRPETIDEKTYYIEIDSNNQIFSINDKSNYTSYLNTIYSRVKTYVNLKYTHIYLINEDTLLQCIGYDGKFIFYNPSGNTIYLTLTKNGTNMSYTIEESTSAKYDELQEQIDNIVFKDVTCTCTINGNVYKGFNRELTVTGKTNVSAANVIELAIMKGADKVSYQSNKNTITYKFTTAGSRTDNFNCVATFDSTYGNKSKTSSNVTFSYIDPIFYGVASFNSFDTNTLDTFASNNAISLNLYSPNSPVSGFSGRTVDFPLTNTNDRAWVITKESRLGALVGGFGFPFFRYSVTIGNSSYYLYVSLRVYDKTHTLVFNSNENY